MQRSEQFVKLWLGCWWIRQIFLWANRKAEREEWGPERVLQAWGFHQQGRLQTVADGNFGSGLDSGQDENSQAAQYVEDVCGFSSAKPVLAWVYARMQPIETFRPRLPGESLPVVLFRHQWGFALGYPESVVGKMVMSKFLTTLSAQLIESPFEPFYALPEEETDYHREAAKLLEQQSLRETAPIYVEPQRDLRHVGYEVRRRHR